MDVCPFEVLEAYWGTEGEPRRIRSEWSLRQAEEALKAKGVEISREKIRRIVGVRMSGQDNFGKEHHHDTVAAYGGEYLPSLRDPNILESLPGQRDVTEVEYRQARLRSVIVVKVYCAACWGDLMNCPTPTHDHSRFVVRYMPPAPPDE